MLGSFHTNIILMSYLRRKKTMMNSTCTTMMTQHTVKHIQHILSDIFSGLSKCLLLHTGPVFRKLLKKLRNTLKDRRGVFWIFLPNLCNSRSVNLLSSWNTYSMCIFVHHVLKIYWIQNMKYKIKYV